MGDIEGVVGVHWNFVWECVLGQGLRSNIAITVASVNMGARCRAADKIRMNFNEMLSNVKKRFERDR